MQVASAEMDLWTEKNTENNEIEGLLYSLATCLKPAQKKIMIRLLLIDMNIHLFEYGTSVLLS
jgi:hypothetical protein